MPETSSSSSRASEIALAVLLLLSVAGIGVSDSSPQWGFQYWLCMVPVFAAVGVWASVSRVRRGGGAVGPVVQRQVLHWLAVAGAVYLLHALQVAGRMTNEASGLSVVVTMALATFLAGVHADWRLCIVGTLLGVAVLVIALVERYLWLIIVPVVAVALIFAWWYGGRRGD